MAKKKVDLALVNLIGHMNKVEKQPYQWKPIKVIQPYREPPQGRINYHGLSKKKTKTSYA